MQTLGSSDILGCQSDTDVGRLVEYALCRSVRVCQSFGETFCFRLLHLERPRTFDVYVLTVAVWRLRV
jgi:hypothetical protein